jgi:hypothetical protein
MPKCEVHPDTELICPRCRGAKGGKKRAKNLSADERKQIASAAVRKRFKAMTKDERKALAAKAGKASGAVRRKGKEAVESNET